MPRTRTADDCSSSWVCVGAVEARQHYDRRSVCFYLTLDPGCVVIKRHEIAAGYFGAPKPKLAPEPVAPVGSDEGYRVNPSFDPRQGFASVASDPGYRTNPARQQAPAILVREGVCFGKPWKQFFVITDGRRAVVEMSPALLYGWNIRTASYDLWPNMTRDQIVAWMLDNNSDGLTERAPDLGEFVPKLIAAAADAMSREAA